MRDHVGMRGVRVPARGSAVALAVSGLIVAVVTPWHPSIFERPVDEVVQGFGAWTLIHVTLVAGVVLALFGAAGLVVVHQGGLGRLGQVALIIEVIGVVATAALAASEAVVFPVLAVHARALLALHGPLL